MARAKSPGRRKTPPSRASPGVAGPGPGLFDGDETDLVVMGRIVGPFGVQGWIKVKPFTEEPGGLGEFARWLVAGAEGWREIDIEDFALHSKGPVAKLAGCDDRESAERLRNRDVAVRRAELDEPEDGSLYWVDLIGLEVVSEQGESLGRVEGLFETGATSVMVVKGVKERMIPFVLDYVKAIDREAKRITVDWKPDYDA